MKCLQGRPWVPRGRVKGRRLRIDVGRTKMFMGNFGEKREL